MPSQPERSAEWRAKQGEGIKASWTPERRAKQAEAMRARRAAMLADPNRKPSKAELNRQARAKREAAKAKRDAQQEALRQYVTDKGGTIKTPEQREKGRQEYLARKASQPPKRDYNAPPWPQSLDALRSECGEHGELVAAHAVAIAARGWACDRLTVDGLIQPGKASRNPAAIVRTSLDLHLCQLWQDAGAAGHWVKYGNPALRDLSPVSRQEAMLVVEETIAEWEAAGSPGLDHAALYAAYRYLCGHVWTGQLAHFARCIDAPPELIEAGLAEPIKLKEGTE